MANYYQNSGSAPFAFGNQRQAAGLGPAAPQGPGPQQAQQMQQMMMMAKLKQMAAQAQRRPGEVMPPAASPLATVPTPEDAQGHTDSAFATALGQLPTGWQGMPPGLDAAFPAAGPDPGSQFPALPSDPQAPSVPFVPPQALGAPSPLPGAVPQTPFGGALSALPNLSRGTPIPGQAAPLPGFPPTAKLPPVPSLAPAPSFTPPRAPQESPVPQAGGLPPALPTGAPAKAPQFPFIPPGGTGPYGGEPSSASQAQALPPPPLGGPFGGLQGPIPGQTPPVAAVGGASPQSPGLLSTSEDYSAFGNDLLRVFKGLTGQGPMFGNDIVGSTLNKGLDKVAGAANSVIGGAVDYVATPENQLSAETPDGRPVTPQGVGKAPPTPKVVPPQGGQAARPTNPRIAQGPTDTGVPTTMDPAQLNAPPGARRPGATPPPIPSQVPNFGSNTPIPGVTATPPPIPGGPAGGRLPPGANLAGAPPPPGMPQNVATDRALTSPQARAALEKALGGPLSGRGQAAAPASSAQDLWNKSTPTGGQSVPPKPKGFTDAQYQNLLRFGTNLMASAQPQRGDLQGPSFLGAVGRAGQKTFESTDAQAAAKAAASLKIRAQDIQQKQFDVKMKSDALQNTYKEIRHAQTVGLKSKELDLRKIQAEQTAEFKKATIALKNATTSATAEQAKARQETADRAQKATQDSNINRALQQLRNARDKKNKDIGDPLVTRGLNEKERAARLKQNDAQFRTNRHQIRPYKKPTPPGATSVEWNAKAGMWAVTYPGGKEPNLVAPE